MKKTTETIKDLHQCLVYDQELILKDIWNLFLLIKPDGDPDTFFENHKDFLLLRKQSDDLGIVLKTTSKSNFNLYDLVYFNKDKIKEEGYLDENTYIIWINYKDCYTTKDDLQKAIDEKYFELAKDSTAEIEAHLKEELEQPVETGNEVDELLKVNSLVGDMFKLNKKELLNGLKTTYTKIKIKEKLFELTDNEEERKKLLSAFYFYNDKTSKSGYAKGVEISSTTYGVDPSKLKSLISCRDNCRKNLKKLG